ncbi:MAG: DUF5996 family protein [Pseudomonadota bacterium]
MTQTLDWPDIPFEPWSETCAALHLFTQIVGKYRLAHSRWVNHSWHATLYVNATGFGTGLIPDGSGIAIQFDLQNSALIASSGQGDQMQFALEPMSVAKFDARFKEMIAGLGGSPDYHGSPNELPQAIPFSEDVVERPWDAEAVSRFHTALLKIDAVFNEFRTSFIGKVSPVHLFWGSFDLAVTRFSGRSAPAHPGGISNLPDDVTREAYSHEVSSAGFWPGGGGIDEPCFYSYAYPSPEGFGYASIEPGTAYFEPHLGEFLLKYDEVRKSEDPRASLLAFLSSTYRAAADLGNWDSTDLERPIGIIGRPHPI